MLQMSPPFWNLVAMQGVKSRFGEFMRIKSQDQLFEEHHRQAELLEKQGYPLKVVLAALALAPLLCEQEAIAKARKQSRVVSEALPEVSSVKEAVQIATREDYLTQREMNQLSALLTRAVQPRPTAS